MVHIPDGEPSCTPDRYKVLALQNLVIDTTKSVNLSGEITLPSELTSPQAVLKRGIDSDSLMKVYTGTTRTVNGQPITHYAQEQDLGLKRKELRRVGPTTYEFYFEAVTLSMPNGAGEVFQITVYAEDGWELGNFRGLIKGWSEAGPLPERGIMRITGTPAYIRVYYPGQTAG